MKMKSKLIKSLVIILWIILSITLVIAGSYLKSMYIISLIIGELAVLLGIVNLSEKFSAWFLVDVGLGFMVYPVCKIIGIDLLVKNNIKNTVLFFGALIAMQLFFDDTLRNKGTKKRCNKPYQAKCTSFEQDTESIYTPVYKYNVNGEMNVFYGDQKKIVNPKLGDVITVFVNEKNKNEVYCPTAKAILMVRYIIGLIVLTFSTGTVFML